MRLLVLSLISSLWLSFPSPASPLCAQTPPPCLRTTAGGGSLRRLFDLADAIALSGGANSTAALLRLIELGDSWRAEGAAEGEHQRVPGCMADARVRSILRPDRSLVIAGYADSRVALGLLALLSRGLGGMAVDDIAALDVAAVLRQCSVAALLPPGRFNGLQSMLTVIKEQAAALARGAPLNVESPQFYNEEVAMLLSGGVDSSVALRLLLDQGRSVRAFYLKIWLEDELAHLNECPWEEDLQYAQAVCAQLGVPLETLSLQKEYWEQVVEYTLCEARQGRTPNPDVMCNSRIKFGVFLDYVGRNFSKVASGHYAQVETVDGMARLKCSPDPVKDQSYFLSNLRQDQLRRCLFPIGHLHKAEVRRLADEFDMPTKLRKDSQGICFLGKLKFDDFIGHYLGVKPGPIRSLTTGEVLGTHRGLWFHTIGQRKGLGPHLSSLVHEGPWYVAAKNLEENILYVTNRPEGIDRPRRIFRVEQINWITSPPPGLSSPTGISLRMKLRHGPTFSPGWLRVVESDRLEATLVSADKGIAPGQFAAFYEEDTCLGAGVISETVPYDPEAPFTETVTRQNQSVESSRGNLLIELSED